MPDSFLLVVSKMKTKGQSSGSSMWMAHPHSMQEELEEFYAHQKGII